MCPTGKSISVSVAVQCVCACVRACVRAKLCAGVRTMIPPGLGRKIGSLWGGSCRAVPGPAGARPPGRYQKLKIKLLFCRGLIASGHAATQEVCFLWVSVLKSLRNFVFFSLPAGPDPPASFVPPGLWGALEKRTTPARELHF